MGNIKIFYYQYIFSENYNGYMLWVCYWNSVTYMFGLQNSTYMHIGLRVAVDYRFNQAKVWTPNIIHHSLTRNVFIYLLPFPNRIPSDISIVHKYANLSQLQSTCTVFKFSDDALLSCRAMFSCISNHLGCRPQLQLTIWYLDQSRYPFR